VLFRSTLGDAKTVQGHSRHDRALATADGAIATADVLVTIDQVHFKFDRTAMAGPFDRLHGHSLDPIREPASPGMAMPSRKLSAAACASPRHVVGVGAREASFSRVRSDSSPDGIPGRRLRHAAGSDVRHHPHARSLVNQGSKCAAYVNLAIPAQAGIPLSKRSRLGPGLRRDDDERVRARRVWRASRADKQRSAKGVG